MDPDAGKLTSPRTFISKYIYVLNNPNKFRDPTGEFPEIFTLGIIGAIVGGLDALFNGTNLFEGIFQGAIIGLSLGGVAAISVTAAKGALILSAFQAITQKGNLFKNFKKKLVENIASTLLLFDPIAKFLKVAPPVVAENFELLVGGYKIIDVFGGACDEDATKFARQNLCIENLFD